MEQEYQYSLQNALAFYSDEMYANAKKLAGSNIGGKVIGKQYDMDAEEVEMRQQLANGVNRQQMRSAERRLDKISKIRARDEEYRATLLHQVQQRTAKRSESILKYLLALIPTVTTDRLREIFLMYGNSIPQEHIDIIRDNLDKAILVWEGDDAQLQFRIFGEQRVSI